jgi:hypothetical protein
LHFTASESPILLPYGTVHFRTVHPDDAASSPAAVRRGRPLREALTLLAAAALPDPGFADDMEAVLADVGPLPASPPCVI